MPSPLLLFTLAVGLLASKPSASGDLLTPAEAPAGAPAEGPDALAGVPA